MQGRYLTTDITCRCEIKKGSERNPDAEIVAINERGVNRAPKDSESVIGMHAYLYYWTCSLVNGSLNLEIFYSQFLSAKLLLIVLLKALATLALLL